MKNELDYILRKNQIPIRRLNEENDDNYRRTKDVLTKVGTYGGGAYIGSALAYQGLKYGPVGPALGHRAKKMSTIVEGFYDKGVTQKDKRWLMVQHLASNEKEEIQKIVKSHAPNLAKHTTKIQEGLIRDEMNLWGDKTFAEHRARLDMEKFERMRRMKGAPIGGYKYTTLKRGLRHERLAQEMIDWTENAKYNKNRLIANGLSEPKVTDMKSAFGAGDAFNDHSRVLTQHGRSLPPDAKVSISHILDVGGDRKAIVGSVTRDAQYQMGEHVMRFADLDDAKSVEKHARERIYSMQKRSSKGLRTAGKWNILHENIDDVEKEVRKFMQTFKYNKKTGIGSIVFSPQYKPHYLVGGVNASVNMATTKSNVLKRNILISDKYDVLMNNDPFQRKVHFNVVTTRDVKRISDRQKVINAFKAKKWQKAMRKAWQLSGKGMGKLVRIALFKR